MERVLKKLAESKAKEVLAVRVMDCVECLRETDNELQSRPESRLPSQTFISAYFGAFRPRE